MAAAQAAAEAALRASEEHSEDSLQHQRLADEGNMQSLLQMMAQEEQKRQQIAALAAIAARPQEHYISIAQNGEFVSSIRVSVMSSRKPKVVLFCVSFVLVLQVLFSRRQRR